MFHNKILNAGTALSNPAIIGRRAFTRDGLMTFDQRTIDSAGAFLIGELERLDQTLHAPLATYTWSRDIDLRQDVSIGDEVSSFTNSSFAAAGGLTPGGKAWISKDANQISGVSLDIGKTANPLTLWGMEIKYTIPELESAQKIGRAIDTQKYEGMQLKYNMDIDEQVYLGDTTLGMAGLVNSASVTPADVANNAAGSSKLWSAKTPDEILADINEALNAAWAASGFAVVPSKLLLPPVKYSYLLSQKVSSAGNISVMEFLKANSLSNAVNGRPLDIQPLKWLTGAGAGGTNRMVVYSQQPNFLRFPMTPLARTPLEYRSLYQITTYYGRLGVVEFVYPETVAYRDGF